MAVRGNFGQRRSDIYKLQDYCVRPEASGKPFVEQVTAKEHRKAIEHIRMMTDAKVARSRTLRLNEIARGARK
jgi:hypothetical protein